MASDKTPRMELDDGVWPDVESALFLRASREEQETLHNLRELRVVAPNCKRLFNQFSNSGQTGSAGSNQLLKCSREFSFQKNGLLYCRACVSS